MARRALSIFFCLFFPFAQALAIEDPRNELKEVGIFTKLGTQVSIDLPFVDTDGSPTTLREVAAGKPLILIPAYYECPRLCGLVLNGTLKLLNSLTLTLGQDYNVAVVSFDPAEGPKDAQVRAEQYRAQLKPENQLNTIKSFRFLTGSQSSISTLLSELNFNIKKDHEDFAHTSAIMILTPQGKISQYFSGIEFPAFDVRLSLVEASQGTIGTPMDHVYLFCFRFDQTKGKYTWAAFNLMRAGALLTLALLLLLGFKLIRDKNNSRSSSV